ncbi:basic proline-rich protein-like [Moschus berezovskii]|uniref:basic proline-rich protein-like n=1 Tax=Moschus berezovskii TaxID=68408 RepID=UPI002443AAEB|nr:basic proline-rich protein-like [Moschus berezovskii]
MGRRRHGGRAIGPRLSRVTKAAGARPPAGAGRRLTGINQVGERARGAGRAGSGRGVEVGARDATREPEDPRGEEAGTRRGRETRPTGRTDDRPPRPPTRGEGAPIAQRTLVPRGPAPPRRRPRETGRGPHPPAGPHRGRPTRPRRPSVHPAPEGRGTPGGEGDRPAAGRPGDPTRTRAEPTGAGTRRRRRTGGGETDDGSGPRHAREARRTGARPRGAADGEERTEAGGQTDGRTERGTDGVQPPEAEATEPAAEAGWPRATARATAQNGRGGGGASRPPGRTAGSHRQRPPSTGAVPRHTRDGGLAAPPPSPLTGLAPTTAYTHPRPQPAGENALPPRTGGPPPRPHARNPACPVQPGLPAPPPQGPEGTAPPGDATGRRDAGGTTPTWGEAGSVRGKERGRGRRRARDEEGRPAAAGRGRRARTAEAAGQGRGCRPGDRETPGRRPGHRDNQRGLPPPPTHTGRSRDARDAGQSPPPAERAPRPGPAARSDPEARHPGDTLSSEAAQTVTARRHRLRLGGEGGRDRQAPPRHGCGDWGKPGPDRPGVAPPLPPPSPWARTTGAGRARARRPRNGSPHRSPDTPSGARRDPPPTRRGEARAAVGKERQHGPTAGPAHPSPPSRGGQEGEVFSAHVLWQSPRWPLRTREGRRLGGPAHGGAPRAAQALSRAGGVCGTAKPTTHTGRRVHGQGRSGARAPPPTRPLIRQPPRRGGTGTPAPLSYRLDPPQRERTHGTHSPPRRGPEEDTGLRETTPPLGLRHLRDNLERSRGTTEEQPRGTLTHPRGARERGSGTALPTAGEAKREHLLCQEDHRAPAG